MRFSKERGFTGLSNLTDLLPGSPLVRRKCSIFQSDTAIDVLQVQGLDVWFDFVDFVLSFHVPHDSVFDLAWR